MTTEMSEEQIYEQAKKRVEEKRGFFIHFSIYKRHTGIDMGIYYRGRAPLVYMVLRWLGHRHNVPLPCGFRL